MSSHRKSTSPLDGSDHSTAAATATSRSAHSPNIGVNVANANVGCSGTFVTNILVLQPPVSDASRVSTDGSPATSSWMSQVIRYLLLCVGDALAAQLASELKQVLRLEDASSQREAVFAILANPTKLPLVVKALSTDLEVQAAETRGSPQPRTWMSSALHQFCQEYSATVPGLQQLRELNDMYFNANQALPTADVVRSRLGLTDVDGVALCYVGK
jgi:hypothetical protein